MIRNVVLVRMADDSDDDQHAALDRGLTGIERLRLPGLVSVHVGRDEDLRPGGWSAAITNDWADEAAYKRYDLDPEHNLYRDLIVEAAAEVARVQFSFQG